MKRRASLLFPHFFLKSPNGPEGKAQAGGFSHLGHVSGLPVLNEYLTPECPIHREMRFAGFLVYGVFSLVMACAGSSNSWIGSVDAVFRYRPSENSTVVYEVRKGSVSAASGLAVGDRLLTIDGLDVSTASFQYVRDALRGPVGTIARLTVKRGDNIVHLAVERLAISKNKE